MRWAIKNILIIFVVAIVNIMFVITEKTNTELVIDAHITKKSK